MERETKKRVLRKLTYGMWVISAASGDDVEASSVTWMTQASFEPPLVIACVKADSHLRKVIESARAFALHQIAADHKDIAATFIKPTKVEDGKIAGRAWKPGVTGAPLLDGFPAHLEAKVVEVVVRGDHAVFVAEVVDAQLHDDVPSLALATTGWSYGG